MKPAYLSLLKQSGQYQITSHALVQNLHTPTTIQLYDNKETVILALLSTLC